MMYADVSNGKFDMTRDDVIALVRDNPFFSDPADVHIVDTDGTEYTGHELLSMAGVENAVETGQYANSEGTNFIRRDKDGKWRAYTEGTSGAITSGFDSPTEAAEIFGPDDDSLLGDFQYDDISETIGIPGYNLLRMAENR